MHRQRTGHLACGMATHAIRHHQEQIVRTSGKLHTWHYAIAVFLDFAGTARLAAGEITTLQQPITLWWRGRLRCGGKPG